MKIYYYHPETKTYMGEGQADPNPVKKGDWLIPAFATTIEPPIPAENQIVKFIDNQWVLEDIPIEPEPEPKPEPEPTIDELTARIRAKRNYLLFQCDWTQLPDVPLTDEQRQQWAVYRQQLRDFPAICDPRNPVWPEQPA